MTLTPYLRIDIDIVAILYLISVIFYIVTQLPKKSKLTSMVYLSIYTCIIGLVASLTTKLVHYTDPNLVSPILILSTIKRIMVVIFAFESAIITLWYIKRKEEDEDKKIPFYLIFILIVTVGLLATNLLIGNVFKITNTVENYLVKGELYILYRVFAYSLYIISTMHILANIKTLTKADVVVLIVFNALALLGATVENMVPQLESIWPCFAMGMMVIINHLEKNVVVYDDLTGAMSRAAFEEFVDSLEKKEKAEFSLAFVDLDGFKLINDKFGHSEGDKALKDFSKEVMNSIPKTSRLIRYGGDEFIIYIDSVNRDILNGIVIQINEAINKRNASNESPYNIKYTLSVQPYDKLQHGTISNLIRKLDVEMYNKKNQKKNRLYKR